MFTVSQFGKPLDSSKYCWDATEKVFSSKESNLLLDFSIYTKATFNVKDYCTIIAGSNCIFNVRDCCTIKTKENSIIIAGKNSVIIRKDVFEIISLEEYRAIKLNDALVPGFQYVTDDNYTLIGQATRKLSELSDKELKKFLAS